MAETILTIRGMTCGHCVEHVTAALRAVPGVTAAAVSLPDQRATISHAPSTALPELLAAVEAAGYEASTAEA